MLYLEEGRISDVKRLAKEMLWIFKTQGVHREALAALKLFCDAAEREAISLEMARRIVAYLLHAQQDPDLRFEALAVQESRPLTSRNRKREGA
ncbi:MAG TPA: hypothetical protein VGG03_05565 [Thermoanaerobaculia bacterium]